MRAILTGKSVFLVYLFQDKRCDGEVVDGSKVLAGSSHKFNLSGCTRRLTSRFLAREPDEGMVIYMGNISSLPILPFDIGACNL